MSSVYWRYLAGDTASFAIEFALVSDEGTSDWMVDKDERGTWGSFSMWVHGVNICEHVAQGEVLRAAHWYLLPVAEWLVEHWNPLLHEERLPARGEGADAARAYQHAALLAELDVADNRGWDSAESVQRWASRHNVRFAAPGALLPDLYIRRYGDFIEFSLGGDGLAGADWGVQFTGFPRAVRVPAAAVSDALYDGIEALARRLVRSDATSDRYRSLLGRVEALDDGGVTTERFAWLAGAGDSLKELQELWQEVSEAIPYELRERFDQIEAIREDEQRTLLYASPAALLFGSLAPDVSATDLIKLYASLLRAPEAPEVVGRFRDVGDRIRSRWSESGLTPGEQGSAYGDEAWQVLGSRSVDGAVDINGIVDQLGVTVDHVELDDVDTRAVSMLTFGGAARIVINTSFKRGESEQVQRFTLAHEIAHLVLDQDRASRMVVASGPWAPRDIEQRANAFAAAFLIPVELLNIAWNAARVDNKWQTIRRVAQALNVSISALVSRLQNLGRLTVEEADYLRPV